MTDRENWEEYRGSLVIPSETDRHGVTVLINKADSAVTLRFDEPVGGSRDWDGADVTIVERLKYHDIQFATNDLPKGDGDAVLEAKCCQIRRHCRRGGCGQTERGTRLR